MKVMGKYKNGHLNSMGNLARHKHSRRGPVIPSAPLFVLGTKVPARLKAGAAPRNATPFFIVYGEPNFLSPTLLPNMPL